MDDNFLAYLERLEILTFFSGYPLVYILMLVITGNQSTKSGIRNKLPSLSPFAYALVGILYLGLQLRNLYPDYSVESIRRSIQQPYLKVWGLLAILFWIPAIGPKRIWSLLHSLVFFFLLVKELFYQQFQATSFDNNIVKNNMKIYTASFILNLVALAVITVLYSLLNYYNKKHSRT